MVPKVDSLTEEIADLKLEKDRLERVERVIGQDARGRAHVVSASGRDVLRSVTNWIWFKTQN